MKNTEEFSLVGVKTNSRRNRGEPYTLERFRQRYGLSANEARDLFQRFGPSAIELDLLMQAKGRSPEN